MAATLAGHLMLPAEGDAVRLAAGVVRIDGGRIVEVVEDDSAARRTQTLICPGFIDTHLHLPQFDLIGAHGLPLLDWLAGVTFPAERRWEDAGHAGAMTRRVVDQLLRVGTTGICAYATVHAEGTRAALDIASRRGLRGVIGQVLMDREAPRFLTHPAAQLLDESAELLDAFPPGSRLAAAVTPRFAITCTPELLAGAGRLAEQRGAVVQSHLAETLPECARVAELFPGASYTGVYRDAGLLRPRSLWGHGIHLDDADRATLRQHGAAIAHCPTANSFLRSGNMPLCDHEAAGVTVTLGSDIGAGYERSMPRVARAMIQTASARTTADSSGFPNAAQAWHRITAGNAAALGWTDAGTLAPGHPADLLVIEPDLPWLKHPDPLAMLLWAWDDRWLKHTYLLGRPASPDPS